MTTDTSDRPENFLICSFCQKSHNQVRFLIAGPGVFICNECVDICNDIISQEKQHLAGEEADKLVESGNLGD
jgi:ATP-dependent Clp protease ATP-binding subunit ClpX